MSLTCRHIYLYQYLPVEFRCTVTIDGKENETKSRDLFTIKSKRKEITSKNKIFHYNFQLNSFKLMQFFVV